MDGDDLDAVEAVAIAHALVQRVREGSLPPDEAYHWTCYVCEALRHLREPAPLTYRLTVPT
jgi:hypothetical protein